MVKEHNVRNLHSATRRNSLVLFFPENGVGEILQNTGVYIYETTRHYMQVGEDKPS
jgi:hypothetical protein